LIDFDSELSRLRAILDEWNNRSMVESGLINESEVMKNENHAFCEKENNQRGKDVCCLSVHPHKE